MTTAILRLPAVISRTGLSRSSIYAFIRVGQFPKQIHLGPRSVGWDSSAIDSWVQEKIEGGGK